MQRTRVLTTALIALVAAAHILIATGHVQAAVPTEPRALALGGAYTTLAAGSEALHWNPANLRANRVPFELSFPISGGLEAHNSYFSLNRLLLEPKQYDSGEEFLADITGGQMQAVGGGGLQSGMNIGSLAVSGRSEAFFRSVLGRDATRLFTVGPEPGTTYTLTGSGLESIGLISGGGGFAFGLTPSGLTERYEDAVVAVGASVKYYGGLFYQTAELTGTIDLSEGSEYSADFALDALYTDFEAVYGSGFSGIQDLAGTGYGIDVGLTAHTSPKLTWGVAVGNVVSKMTWRHVKRIQATVEGELISAGDRGPVLPEDPSDFSTYTESDVPTLERRLPMDVRAGVSYRFSPKAVIAADVAKTIVESSLERPLSLRVGAELTPFAEAGFGRRLAFRLGYERTGSHSFYSYGVGFALWKWEFDIGVRVSESLQPVDAQGAAFSIASRIRW